jgi:hypothetical protein
VSVDCGREWEFECEVRVVMVDGSVKREREERGV